MEDLQGRLDWALEDIRRELAEIRERLDGLDEHLESISPRPIPEPTPMGKAPLPWRRRRSEKLPRCDFCGKDQTQVRKLIAGPGVYICDECSDLVRDIIEEELDAEVGAEASAVEVAALLGLTRQRVYQLAAEKPDFPQPIKRSPAKWRRADVDEWKEQNRT